jgi:dihydrofolate reductase
MLERRRERVAALKPVHPGRHAHDGVLCQHRDESIEVPGLPRLHEPLDRFPIAGERDIRIAGGAHAILQYLNAGLVDEFSIALAPVLFGSGVRLFDGIVRRKVAVEIAAVVPSRMVTHLNYRVQRRRS